MGNRSSVSSQSIKSFISALFLFAAQIIIAQPFELAGLLTSQEQGTLIVLTDKADNVSSPWLAKDQAWRGYRVTKVDVNGGHIVLTKDGMSTTLYLKDARVKDNGASRATAILLLQGKAKKDQDRAVYTPDAILRIGPYNVTARTGSMESEGSWVVGDLTIEAANGATIPAGSVGLKDGKIKISAKKVDLPAPDPTFPSESPRKP